jgi:predicted ATP-dependent endonuclease of OLD family
MKLVKFSVTNFRSIEKASNINVTDITVLVGKNNEGKSNLLKALAASMNAIASYAEEKRMMVRHGISRPRMARRISESVYAWDRDFPIASKSNIKNIETWFKLEFELSSAEIIEFKSEIKSSLNGTLPIEIWIGKDNIPKIKVAKGGRGSATLNSKSDKITDYIAKKISFNYIPAVRTHQEVLSVIEDALDREMSSLEADADYKKAIDLIESVQMRFLDSLSTRIKEPLSEFLPSIKNVQIISSSEDSGRLRYRRYFDIIVDDGTPTSIEYKGDGVKSLAALGLLKNKSNKSGASIIAIEEPESHLHSGAIHQLQSIIKSLGEENQIVLTTHNPLFVNREKISANIIVENGKAKSAKNIGNIRDTLGVLVSDNLVSARYTLFVEGEDDKISLEALLPILSVKIGSALKNSVLIISPLGGVGGLTYALSTFENQLYAYHVFLDNDKAAADAIEKAKKKVGITSRNITQTICIGQKESEFEDCLIVDCYKNAVHTEFAVTLDGNLFKDNTKWSERVKATFLNRGKAFDDDTKMKLKLIVAECVRKNPKNAICPTKGAAISALVTELESLIE